MARPTEPEIASIYGLFDKDGQLRYIGKAVNPEKRLAGHMRNITRRRTPLYDWLNKHGLPVMKVLEADCGDWREAEKRLIKEARERGDKLLNVADGGDQPYCSPEVRAAHGQRLKRWSLGLEPIKPITREQLIIDTYTWVRNNYLKHGMTDRASAVVERMRKRYAENPVTYKLWAKV